MIVVRQPVQVQARAFPGLPMRIAGGQATLGDTLPAVPSIVPGVSQGTLLIIAGVVLGGAALLWLGRKYGGAGGGDFPAQRRRHKTHNVKLTDALLWAGGAAAIAYFAGRSKAV